MARISSSAGETLDRAQTGVSTVRGDSQLRSRLAARVGVDGSPTRGHACRAMTGTAESG